MGTELQACDGCQGCKFAPKSSLLSPIRPTPDSLESFCMAAVSLSVSTVKPLGDRVFVKVSASEEKTAGGILLPDTAKEKPQVGEIAAVGPGKRNDDGSRQDLEVKLGDKVLYSKYAGTDIKLGNEEYVLLSEKDILAIVN